MADYYDFMQVALVQFVLAGPDSRTVTHFQVPQNSYCFCGGSCGGP